MALKITKKVVLDSPSVIIDWEIILVEYEVEMESGNDKGVKHELNLKEWGYEEWPDRKQCTYILCKYLNNGTTTAYVEKVSADEALWGGHRTWCGSHVFRLKWEPVLGCN